MESQMTDSQFMVQVINIFTKYNELQMILMKNAWKKENPLTSDELREELSLRYQSMSLVVETSNGFDLTEEKALFKNRFQVKCQNCGNMGHKATDCKARRVQQPRVETQAIWKFCKKPVNHKSYCIKLLRKNQNLGIINQRNFIASATTDTVLSTIDSHDSFKHIWIGDSAASCHY
jgi:hypothetical protein